ncbi:CHAP domain-containing protein [Pseudooceanicola sp. 502str34]|uniref:CHAP domain-containing protein n=1 Tax=Maritimibacter alkaliphilus TaxID=404236 RepID=UPI001C96EA64|nr:CHAP domain-containing protein [Maritimibacter alkaliphilus]MBY6089169.1 CHAP domain-containing protein [Maritimibacter alkaliphilus]
MNPNDSSRKFAGDEVSMLDPERQELAVATAEALRARGGRVWCVPFARNASGVEIRGDARTWWRQAEGKFDTSHTPQIGAVMAFKATRGMPLGHVAVVSNVVSERKILIDHANWHRNQVSLAMGVIDVSENNDWSKVRVESAPDSYGSVYPISGFINPSIAQEQEPKKRGWLREVVSTKGS